MHNGVLICNSYDSSAQFIRRKVEPRNRLARADRFSVSILRCASFPSRDLHRAGSGVGVGGGWEKKGKEKGEAENEQLRECTGAHVA
jgi:hypothetical protein